MIKTNNSCLDESWWTNDDLNMQPKSLEEKVMTNESLSVGFCVGFKFLSIEIII